MDEVHILWIIKDMKTPKQNFRLTHETTCIIYTSDPFEACHPHKTVQGPHTCGKRWLQRTWTLSPVASHSPQACCDVDVHAKPHGKRICLFPLQCWGSGAGPFKHCLWAGHPARNPNAEASWSTGRRDPKQVMRSQAHYRHGGIHAVIVAAVAS